MRKTDCSIFGIFFNFQYKKLENVFSIDSVECIYTPTKFSLCNMRFDVEDLTTFPIVVYNFSAMVHFPFVSLKLVVR